MLSKGGPPTGALVGEIELRTGISAHPSNPQDGKMRMAAETISERPMANFKRRGIGSS